jgi:hypothetical protein
MNMSAFDHFRFRGHLDRRQISTLADAVGNIVDYMLLPDQRHGSIGVDTLLDGIVIDTMPTDNAFD